MKKIFTLIFVAATAFCFGQSSLELAIEGITYSADDTVNLTVSRPNADFDSYIDISNISTNDVEVYVTFEKIQTIEGSTFTFCVDGSCWGGSMPNSEAFTIAAGSTLSHSTSDNALHTIYKTPSAGFSIIALSIINKADPTDCFTLYLKYNYTVGIASNTANTTLIKAYPNPASNNVTFDIKNPSQSGNNSRLVIKNLMGMTVYTKPITNTDQKLMVDISNLISGVYFYSIEIDGITKLTKKLLIK